ncbi:MAG: DUF1592 domain-containing protein [Myxococcales bacterium]|nr:DUF1592 domain-containing protein [Myxococcales bacterium]
MTVAVALAGCYAGAPAGDSDSDGASGASGTASMSASASASASASGGSGDSDGDSDGDTDTGGPPALPFEPGPPTLPRLTAAQYNNALRDVLGAPLPTPSLEPDTNPYLFFNIGAASTTVSEVGVQRYEEAAEAISKAVFGDAARREALVGCVPEAADDACAEAFVTTFGRRLMRRPLSAEERGRWLAFAAELADGDPWEGLRMAVAGMLQSPHFLYRVELGEAAPTEDDPTRRRYTGWEIATRLSFLLWNTTPDDQLLDAAEAGLLDTEEGIRVEAERLLEDPRARAAIQAFFAQYLDLGRLDQVERDSELYPLYTPSLAEAMRTEVELLVDDFVHREEADVRGLFTTRRTFVNEDLAKIYGVEAKGASPITFVPVELPEDGPRAGILTLGAFLMMNAHATETSPTLRGKYVRERVLCEEVPAPPGDVDTNIPEPDGEAHTLRERLEQHRADPACAGCHAFIDPPGFLFEHFDSIGNYRDLDNGYPIDASGELDGAPLAGARDLADALADDKRVARCMVTQLYRNTAGRLELPGERPGIKAVEDEFAASGYRYRELLLAFVTSEAFRTVATPEDL